MQLCLMMPGQSLRSVHDVCGCYGHRWETNKGGSAFDRHRSWSRPAARQRAAETSSTRVCCPSLIWQIAEDLAGASASVRSAHTCTTSYYSTAQKTSPNYHEPWWPRRCSTQRTISVFCSAGSWSCLQPGINTLLYIC